MSLFCATSRGEAAAAAPAAASAPTLAGSTSCTASACPAAGQRLRHAAAHDAQADEPDPRLVDHGPVVLPQRAGRLTEQRRHLARVRHVLQVLHHRHEALERAREQRPSRGGGRRHEALDTVGERERIARMALHERLAPRDHPPVGGLDRTSIGG